MGNHKMAMVSTVAEEVGRDRSSVLKTVKRMGLKSQLLHGGAGHQKSVFISDEDAVSLKAHYATTSKGNSEGGVTRQCVFYMVNIMPNQPDKVTCGVSLDITRRLREYKTAWPEATLLESFPCKISHEVFLLDVVKGLCDQVGPEHFIIVNQKEVAEAITKALSCVV